MSEGRPFRWPDDVDPIRDFLAACHPLSPPGLQWDLRRWEGGCYYAPEPGLDPERAAMTRLWEDGSGRVAALHLSDGDVTLHPHTRPGERRREEEVLAWALRAAADRGQRRALVGCFEYDRHRASLLARLGFEATERFETFRTLRCGNAPPDPSPTPAGYTLRATRPERADHERLAALLNAAFGRTIHHAGETEGFQANAPCFVPTLDLVAEAPDGGFAAYAALCWDERNRRGTFEPVCTHPGHRRLGLAGALMREGMRRAHHLGALEIDVATGDADPANALYDSLPFTERYRSWWWRIDL